MILEQKSNAKEQIIEYSPNSASHLIIDESLFSKRSNYVKKKPTNLKYQLNHHFSKRAHRLLHLGNYNFFFWFCMGRHYLRRARATRPFLFINFIRFIRFFEAFNFRVQWPKPFLYINVYLMYIRVSYIHKSLYNI